MANDRKPSPGAGKDLGSGSSLKNKGNFSRADVEAEVAKRLAKSEKERLEKAKKIAAEIQRKAILAAASGSQDGGPSTSAGTLGNETPGLLRNMCGILNKGFASLGADMKTLHTSVNGQFNALSESMEANMNDFWGGFEYDDEVDDVSSVGGDFREPGPPEPFAFGNDHDMSEEEDNPDQDGGVGGARGALNAANMVENHPNNPNDGENFFARFARTLRVPTDVGADLDPHLANLVNQLFERPLPMEEFVRIKESTLRPANCIQLQVPPVPEAIWVKISGELKGRDKSMQKLHSDFLCFVFKVLKCVEKLNELCSSCPDIDATVEDLAEALRIAGHIHRIGFTEQRRETLKPDLPGEFKRLAGSNFPPCPSSLFGDNLVENLKSISEVARLSEKMAAAGKPKGSNFQQQRGRYHPYARGRGTSFRHGRGGRGRGRGWRGFNPSHASGSAENSQAHPNPSSTRGKGFRGRGAANKQ